MILSTGRVTGLPTIRAIDDLDAGQRAVAVRILREALPTAYQAPGEAEAEIASFLAGGERFALAALDGEAVLGWIGGEHGYPHALELHPLVVDPACRRSGVGTALVAALEARARALGCLTVWLGADDETGGTSLAGADLWPDPLARLAAIRPAPAGHPFFFYRRLGYAPVGVLPDANGFGRPDILLAKRIAGVGRRDALSDPPSRGR